MSSSGMDPKKEKVAKSAKNPAPAAAPEVDAPVAPAVEAEAPAPTAEAPVVPPPSPPPPSEVEAPPPAAPTTKASAPESSAPLFEPEKMGILNDVNIAVTIEIGRAELKIKDLLNLTKGAIIELNKTSGDPVEVYANGKLISLGDIITVNGKYCVRLSAFKEGVQLGAKK